MSSAAINRSSPCKIAATVSIESAAGFTPRHHEIVTEIVAPDWQSFVRKSALRADSFLARLSDTEFEQGMAALRAHGANIDPAEAVTEEIDWFVFTKRA